MATDFVDLRVQAIKAIGKTLSEKKPLDECLPEVHPDRDWLLEVTAGTLRYWGRIDLILEQHSLKKAPTGAVRRALATGIYQLLGQDRCVPAVVASETVEAIKRREGIEPSRFANALLRKVIERLDSWKTLGFPSGESLKMKAQWASLPEWLFQKLSADYGEEWVKLWSQQQLRRPDIWIRSREELAFEKGPVQGSYRVTQQMSDVRPMLEAGSVFVQDLSSQYLVSHWSKLVQSHFKERPLEGIKVLDACAAPGGKSVGLAWNGFSVDASDQKGARLELLGQNLKKLAADKAKVVENWEALSDESYDWVWIDAPCSSMGLIRRHPEIRWIKTFSEIESLSRIQKGLIEKGLKKVRSGGILTFSVCSVLKQEGESHERVVRDLGVTTERVFVEPFDTGLGDGFQGFSVKKTAV